MKQATVSYMKFSKELTQYNVNVATHTLRLDYRYVHAENSSNSLQRPTLHSKEREEPNMVLSHGKSTTPKPRSSREKLVRKEFVHQYLIAFKLVK